MIDDEALLLPHAPRKKPPGRAEMLHLIAYDIACPKRLRRVSQVCEDYGIRVQKSLFECWLEDVEFQELWTLLSARIDAKRDCLVAYTLDAGSARRRRTAGANMVCTSRVECYSF